MSSKKSKTKVKVVATPPEKWEPQSISEYIARMTSDAAAIDKSLMEAPICLTEGAEPALFNVLREIQASLKKAKKIWDK